MDVEHETQVIALGTKLLISLHAVQIYGYIIQRYYKTKVLLTKVLFGQRYYKTKVLSGTKIQPILEKSQYVRYFNKRWD